jgi:hypothetical protein
MPVVDKYAGWFNFGIVNPWIDARGSLKAEAGSLEAEAEWLRTELAQLGRGGDFSGSTSPAASPATSEGKRKASPSLQDGLTVPSPKAAKRKGTEQADEAARKKRQNDAAQRSRLKARAAQTTLHNKVRALEAKNRELKRQASALKDESLALQNQCLSEGKDPTLALIVASARVQAYPSLEPVE